MGKIGAARGRLATAQGAALNDPSPPHDARPSASSMKHGCFPGNRLAALRHFQPLHLFNSGVL
jgi:hypothetical protein